MIFVGSFWQKVGEAQKPESESLGVGKVGNEEGA